MPPTKAYAVRRLDSVEQEVVLLKKGTGAECLDKVRSERGLRACVHASLTLDDYWRRIAVNTITNAEPIHALYSWSVCLVSSQDRRVEIV